ncbi:hypothetical protein [Nocardioides limicola]|uniref:hypothetical protein n=1 Tax=Nocardioides limicola TaxID=2803368 RepID=UPI00193C173E|nr:hypothetical protein [Nocardioides sp. DJM-14]
MSPITQPRTRRRPAWLLLASLPPVVGFVIVTVTSLVPRLPDSESSSAALATAQLAQMRPAWILMHLLWAAPVVLGALGVFVLAGGAPGRFAGIARVLAPVAVVVMVGYLLAQVALLGADGPTVGDSSVYTVGLALSLVGFWAAVLATIATCVELIRHRVVPRVAGVVAALCGLYLVFDLVAYLPAMVSETRLDEAIGLPPIVVAVFWAILGGGLLRRVPSEV